MAYNLLFNTLRKSKTILVDTKDRIAIDKAKAEESEISKIALDFFVNKVPEFLDEFRKHIFETIESYAKPRQKEKIIDILDEANVKMPEIVTTSFAQQNNEKTSVVEINLRNIE